MQNGSERKAIYASFYSLFYCVICKLGSYCGSRAFINNNNNNNNNNTLFYFEGTHGLSFSRRK